VKLLWALVVMPFIACAGSASGGTTPLVVANQEAVVSLAVGQVESLPTGPVFVRFIGFTQPPGYVINSKQHVPSIVYVVTGTTRLVLSGQPPVDIAEGQAKFHQSVTHMHLNVGTETSLWYSIGVWPSSARSQPLVDAIAKPAFESGDIDPAQITQQPYSEALRRVTLPPGGSSGAHHFGGLATFFVLQGMLAIRNGHGAPAMLAAGQGLQVPPDTDLVETNKDDRDTVFLEYVVTPTGKDFEVPVRTLPPA
jgi:quercetin dioxygenase-like cupin family protein